MSAADGMRKMIALGIPMDEALAILEAFEVPAVDARKERNRRYYETHKPVLKRLNSDARTDKVDRLKASEKRLNSDGASHTHVEDKPLTSLLEPQEIIEPIVQSTLPLSGESAVASMTPLKLEPEPKTSKANRGTRLEPGWRLQKAWGDWAMQEFPFLTADAVRQMADEFFDYRSSAPGQKGLSRDWFATWRNNVRMQAGRYRPRGSPGRPLSGLAALTENFKQELENDGYGRQGEESGDPVADARFPLLAGPNH